jgi:hypothetical protein
VRAGVAAARVAEESVRRDGGVGGIPWWGLAPLITPRTRCCHGLGQVHRFLATLERSQGIPFGTMRVMRIIVFFFVWAHCAQTAAAMRPAIMVTSWLALTCCAPIDSFSGRARLRLPSLQRARRFGPLRCSSVEAIQRGIPLPSRAVLVVHDVDDYGSR